MYISEDIRRTSVLNLIMCMGKTDLRNDIQSTNMVLGIDEYLEGDARDKDLEFINLRNFSKNT